MSSPPLPPSLHPPSPQSITPPQFTHLQSLYPSVLQRVYERKIKDPGKLAQALEDDKWRYGYESGGLRDVVQERRGRRGGKSEGESRSPDGGWIEKEELERLVRWKITHGSNRPFLPAQIRKNAPDAVKSTTVAAFATPAKTTNASAPERNANNPNNATKNPAIPPFPSSPLKSLMTLTGVGPATATLLLSIHDPVSVPFFQDELYGWLCSPGVSQGGGSVPKLKYNIKEYEELYEAVGVLRRRLGPSGGVRADEVERVGFVVGHWGDVEDGERTKVLSGDLKVPGEDGNGENTGDGVVEDVQDVKNPKDGARSESRNERERVGKRKRGSGPADGEKEKEDHQKSVAPARKAHRSSRHS